jgi:hypothetical protein
MNNLRPVKLRKFEPGGKIECPTGKFPYTYQKGMMKVTECLTVEEFNRMVSGERVSQIIQGEKDKGKNIAQTELKNRVQGDIRTNNNIKSEKQILQEQAARQNRNRNTSQISTAQEEPSVIDRTLDVISHPTEAFSYLVQGRDLPTRMSGSNPYDMVFGFPGQVIRSGKNLLGAAFSPIETGTALGAGAVNLFTNLIKPGENLFDESYNNKAIGLGLDLLNVAGGRAVGKNALRLYDRNFTKVGQALNKIEREGLEKGLSSHDIAKRQMQEVGITSNQRKAYTPILSNFAYKNIFPVGYGSAASGQSTKLLETIKNIRAGGLDYKELNRAMPSRVDAWRLYLGKPQINNTFRIAETSPVGHRSYNPTQLSNMDIYSINPGISRNQVLPNFRLDVDKDNLIGLGKNLDLFKKNISYSSHPDIMGGYNRRLNQYGLEYNDIWDLQPEIIPYNFLPNKLKNTLGESFLFSEKVPKYGITSPRSFRVDMSRFLGKPFMSHEVMTEYPRNILGNEFRQALENRIPQYQKLVEERPFMKPKLIQYQGYLDELNKNL